jgi:small nuclear ribonucleoprotein (snRNP)-like protein
MGRRRARPTLAVLLQALEGQKVVLELRRDVVVRGTLLSCDAAMNMQLADATATPLGGAPRAAAWLHVRGRALRYAHLPASLDPAAAVAAAAARRAAALREHARAQGAAPRLPKGDGAAPMDTAG